MKKQYDVRKKEYEKQPKHKENHPKKQNETEKVDPAEVWKNASKLITTKKKEVEPPVKKEEEEVKKDDITIIKERLEAWSIEKNKTLEKEGCSFNEYRKSQIANALKFYDDERDCNKKIIPQNPFEAPSFFPKKALHVFENEEIYKKLDIDTLFWIFYTQKDTIRQYFVTKILKQRSWRFHTKYNTWFQRLEEPKYITEEYEQGSYMFFDYDTTWSIRKKADFTFEYKFLESSDV